MICPTAELLAIGVTTADAARLREMPLEELWKTAEDFGAVHVYSDRDTPAPDRYHVLITFDTIPGVELEARSKFRLPITEAFAQAIEKSREISTQFKVSARG